MKRLPGLVALALLAWLAGSGCKATAHKTNALHLGMSKDQVIAAMGTPHSAAGMGNIEVLQYRLYATADDAFFRQDDLYFVRIVNGVVESYGKQGELDPAILGIYEQRP